ncbi:hypothetical protein [Chakrabartyella piscis]|uniref:hypothetical protein n=1 Tax=Chakrabartyella piscis TaxID=2918914 RepID=UPI00295878F3|nr:hypothetical protein [Chakrabartyella piscis]
MYPYNRNTTISTASKNQLAEDKRLLELLTISMQEAMDVGKRYEILGNDPILQEESQITKSMVLDQLKHGKLLQEAAFLITEEKPMPLPKGNTPTLSGKELLEDTLLLEIDNHDFYRTLYLSIPMEEVGHIFFEIASDKQSHATALTFLFAKYFV